MIPGLPGFRARAWRVPGYLTGLRRRASRPQIGRRNGSSE